MSEQLVQWTTPAPFWTDLIEVALPSGLGRAGSAEHDRAREEFQRPSLLRFTRDTFMEEFITLLENSPTQLAKLRAFRETWRGPVASLPPVAAKPRFERPFALRKALTEKMQTNRGKPAQTLKELIRPDPPRPTDVFGSVPQALKLYQPAHMRYYLVSACLVCQTTGLPDRALNSATQERVGFVVRRLIPKDADNARATGNPYPAVEYGFVKESGQTGWKNVGNNTKSLLPGEEQQPLFPVSFTQVDGRRRRLFSGVVPVGRQGEYLGTPDRTDPDHPPADSNPPLRPGEQLFITQVIEPWKRLIELNFAARNRIAGRSWFPDPSSSEDKPMSENAQMQDNFIKSTREQIQTASWLILLDFARLLAQYLPDIWKRVMDPNSSGSNADDVFKKLQGTRLKDALMTALVTDYYKNEGGINRIKTSLDTALRAIVADPTIATHLEKAIDPFNRDADETGLGDWPRFLFPLADPVHGEVLPPFLSGDKQEATEEPDTLLEPVDHLLDSIRAALPIESSEPTPVEPLANQPVMDGREGWFVLRCVMERPDCAPHLAPALVSEPTAPFQMAGFFDPDAPARPIRISLPVDTTPAGLRKFDKNTAFMISDVLCGQIQRAKGMSLGDLIRSVLPWPLHKDLSVPDNGPCENAVGMICSLSIPIITICALILLMIIVSLLDIIFHWIPYFIMCFPLPRFAAKET